MTLRFGGKVKIDHVHKGPYRGDCSNAVLKLYSLDERLLDTISPDSEGNYLFEVQIDKADYILGKPGYYLVATFIDEEGTEYSNLPYEGSPGVKLSLSALTPECIAPYDHTGRDFGIAINYYPY